MRLLGHFSLICLISFSVGDAAIPKRPRDGSPLDEAFDKKVEWALDHYGIPGLAIAVIKDGDTFSKGYGVSDIKTSRPVTEHTLFYGGSTAKAITAAAVSLLVDDPSYPDIQWATPLHSIIPDDFSMIDPWYTAHVTLTDILSHRSGLPRHDYTLLSNMTMTEIVKSVKDLPLTAEIRTQFQYSSTLFVAAAHMIEKVTGQTLHDFVKERIWTPLNMSESYFLPSEAHHNGRDISKGYFIDPQGRVTAVPPGSNMFHIRGAGCILSSVHDYAKWISAFIHRSPPLSKAGYSALLGAQSIELGEIPEPFNGPILYGMGWYLQTYRDQPMVVHTGAQWGFGALAMFLPKRELGIVILGNNMLGTNSAINSLSFDIVDRILNTPESDRFPWAEKADQVLEGAKLTNATYAAIYPDLPEHLEPHPLDLSAYEGTYTHRAFPDIRLSTKCPPLDLATVPEKWTGASLCVYFIGGAVIPSPVMNLYHISGASWAFVTTIGGQRSATRAEIRVNAGKVDQLGLEESAEMVALLGEKVWWAHVH